MNLFLFQPPLSIHDAYVKSRKWTCTVQFLDEFLNRRISSKWGGGGLINFFNLETLFNQSIIC